jgi:hypothetical protein
MSEPVRQPTVLDSGQEHLGAQYARALLGAAARDGQAAAVVEELDAFVAEVLDRAPRLEATLASYTMSPTRITSPPIRLSSCRTTRETRLPSNNSKRRVTRSRTSPLNGVAVRTWTSTRPSQSFHCRWAALRITRRQSNRR